jgi:signal transduction histidine kinase/CheY-like chemotaxis protein
METSMARFAELSSLELAEQLAALKHPGARAGEPEEAIRELQMCQIELEMRNRELRETQRQLEVLQGRYGQLFDQAPVGFVNLDANGIVLDANAVASALLGQPRGALIGTPFAVAARIKDKGSIPALMRECVVSPSRVVTEVECEGPGGCTLVLRLAATCNPIARTEITDFRVALTDLTPAQQARADQAQLASERRARLEADEANRMKDQFLGIVSHELRTPLNSILGWSQMAQLRADDRDVIRRAMSITERNAKALARIVDDILDVSRIVSGKLQVNLTKTDFAEVTRAALELARPGAIAKGVTLRESLADRCTLRGDPGRLEQVVTNLLSNAIKFSRPGGQVQVTLARTGQVIRLSVSDDGCGIDAADLPHVFEAFRQADRSTTRTHSGLGLGLAIAHHIVVAHGGEITAQSDGPGAGTTVVVSLPAALFSTPPPPPSSRSQANSEGRASLEGVKVLFVDDESAARELAELLLGDLGAIVETAGSVDAALQRIEAFVPDVVVSDIAMPERDGLDLIRAIRALDAPVRAVPAIALTAYARAEDVQHAMAAGFTAHVPKPAGTERLAAAIADLVRRT